MASVATPNEERTPLLPPQFYGRSASTSASSLTSSASGENDSREGCMPVDPPTSASEDPSDDVEREAALAAFPNKGKIVGSARLLQIMVVLIIGAFMVNADISLVLVTNSTIGSEFNALEDSSWLFTAYILAGCTTQALQGKLSDIIGRGPLLLISYFLFAIGCALVGMGQFMWQVILGRVVSGFGGSALSVASSLLITDLVPLRDVAAWQAGLNMIGTVGRTLGGPLGGFLADTAGWRWSFLVQSPVFFLGMLLCAVYLPQGSLSSSPESNPAVVGGAVPPPVVNSITLRTALSRIDFKGALLLALFIFTILLPLELGGSKIAWSSPLIFVLLGISVALGGLFYLAETRSTKEPIFPLALLAHRDIQSSYLVVSLQIAAQFGLMFSVPLYFQVTERASNTAAGAYLSPAVVGNAFGAILGGIWIKRSGRYKRLMVIGTFSASLSYVLLLLRWHEHISVWEVLYIIPAGFGTGVANGATFVSLQAAVSPQQRGPATAGLFLMMQIGMILGLASVSAVILQTMRRSLDARLLAEGIVQLVRQEIIQKAASSVDYLDIAEGRIAAAVTGAYLDGLAYSHAVSLLSSALALVSALRIQEHRL